MSSKSSPCDFSLFSLFTAGLACFVPLASAYTQPQGSAPKGNPIHTPALNNVIPAGKDYTVTWQPTTSGTVTLVLLKGPSTDALPQYPIAEKIPNDGKFVWKPSTDLVPGHTGYGIQLIDDATGQYQYSTQFGISNADFKASSSSSDESSSASAAAASTSAAASVARVTKQAPAKATAHPIANTTTPCSTTLTKTWVLSGTGVGTGVPGHNSTIILPTKPMTVPASLITTTVTALASAPNATASRIPSHSNGAASSAHVATSFLGLVVAAGVAVLAL